MTKTNETETVKTETRWCPVKARYITITFYPEDTSPAFDGEDAEEWQRQSDLGGAQ